MCFLIGVLGSLLPFVPAPLFLLGGILVFVFWQGVAALGWGNLLFLAGLSVLAMLADNLASLWGAKKHGASKIGLLGALLGALLGLFVGGPLGALLGPLLGAFLFELAASGSWVKARQISWGTFLGFLTGIFARFIIALVVVIWFLAVVF